MGIYGDYLDEQPDFQKLTTDRKKYLKKLSKLRDGNCVLTYAADLNLPDPNISIIYDDILSISDQLDNLSGATLDVIIETPGGLGTVAEDIVNMFRTKFETVNFIIPGCAKSAGTIIVMSGDEILMESSSSLGPIDAQLSWGGKTFSADAFLEGLNAIKKEVEKTGVLNKAYIPILSNISLGEIEHAENSLGFAHNLVTQWLTDYKFKNWTQHSSTGEKVTKKEREQRARKIAKALSNQKRWKTHGRSIKIKDLEELQLKITDYSKDEQLFDCIKRYYTLLRMSLSSTNIYKIIETAETQIYKFKIPPGARPTPSPTNAPEAAIVDVICPKCKTVTKVQASFKGNLPIQHGCVPFPKNNELKCGNCGSIINIRDVRLGVESESKKRIL